ncbi:hypothetical protein E8E15_008223 [Penicillium rubens]|uniref:Pc21g10800 protein n=2 Tax=Penicillium chrysogenum species complex TaxID=254878 RepID=B6HJE3_PENRW|nr:uncharacterized protein N7525_007660 [Penicillium rubens]KAF3027752.1 hypothetical protein E8E15_008223 [Penicillium rubens]KAJ5829407.1 hypothetical protein N7525_007660 [Penicillium rubens]CAP95977.1 Pc21g10800 [Penicillium rubens Wisconsin 54-1255]
MLAPLLGRCGLPTRASWGYLSVQPSRGQRFCMHTNRGIITQMLRLIDSTQHIQQYLGQFHPSQGKSLAVIALGPNSLSPPRTAVREQLEQLADSLAFLRRVGLFPVVVHGELDLDLPSISRVEGPSDQPNRLCRIRTTNYQLSALLEQQDVETRPISSGIFTSVSESDGTMSYHQGHVTDVATQGIKSAIHNGYIPVVAALGTSSAESRTYALDTHDAVAQLARVLQPLRSIFLVRDASPSSLSALIATSPAMHDLARELRPHASIMLGEATALRSTIFPDPALWTVLRNPRIVQSATSLQDFPSREALRTALQRHVISNGAIDINALLTQLETRDFIAYFDHDPISPAPEQTVNNLALVFTQASFPWQFAPSLPSGDAEAYAPRSMATSVEQHSIIGNISELALFSISHLDWHNGVAERFWDRIREDHVSLWGSMAETDPSLSWWLTRSSGRIKRQLEEKIYMWYGPVT